MLGWFTRHQKSLMLVLLAPALIGMGITGAILAVLQNPGDVQAGKVFGEEISQQDFQRIRDLYQRTAPQAGDEQAWRFFALYRAAQKAGLEVSDAEVGRDITTSIGWDIAHMRATEQLQQENLDLGSREAQQRFRELMMKYLLEDRPEFTEDEYRKVLEVRKGLSVQEYERQQKREALVQRYLDILRGLAVVEPGEVREAYQEEHHLRALDLIEIPAATYLPELDAEEGEPGHVSDAQVQAYYDLRLERYDEPRRVELAYIGLAFADIEDELAEAGVSRDELWAFNEREGIATVASFDAMEDTIRDAYLVEAARLRVARVMDHVADLVEEAEKVKQPLDLVAIAKQAGAKADTTALTHGTTKLIDRETLDADPLLGSWAAQRWFDTSTTGLVSDVLGGPKGWYLLHTKQVEIARTPAFEEIAGQVRADYVDGADDELDDQYQQFMSTRYRRDVSWLIEVVSALDAKFEGDHAKAKEALAQAVEVSRDWPTGYSLRRFETDPDVKAAIQLKYHELEPLERDALEGHPILGAVAGQVTTAKHGQLQPVAERGDKTGWILYRVVKKVPNAVMTFDECKDRVREDVRLNRALTRAEAGAEDVLAKLRHKTGEALTKVLADLKLTPERTPFFARDAVAIEGIDNPGKLVSEAFSAEAVVGSGYARAVADPAGHRVYLVRVAERQDAPEEGYAEKFASLRKDLLSKKRSEYATEQVRELNLRAKGISQEHLDYAIALRDAPDGTSKLRIRQIFLPPDVDTVEGWLENAAKARIGEAEQALAGGEDWAVVVDRFSEDDATRSRAGELPPVQRGDLAEDFGSDFDEGVWGLQPGQVRALRSNRGWHLVRLKKAQGQTRTVQHLLIHTDAEMRNLPQAVRDKAEAISKAAMDKAAAELAAGRPFALVAEEIGDADDAYGQGQELEMEFVTDFERAAFAEYLEWELPEDHPKVDDLFWLPEVVEVKDAGGQSTYQLFACARDTNDQGAAWETRARRNRRVFHIQGTTKPQAEAARAELLEMIEDEVDAEEDRPAWQKILDEFQKLAREMSKAPSRTKGGALGLMRLSDPIRPYGDLFLQKACYTDAGQPVGAGHRTGVFRGEAGFHIVEVVAVEDAEGPRDPAKPDKGKQKRRSQVADLLLEGTDWK